MYAWIDTTITVACIKPSPHKWKSYISNRVSHIQEKISPEFWYHVRSNDNPADCFHVVCYETN